MNRQSAIEVSNRLTKPFAMISITDTSASLTSFAFNPSMHLIRLQFDDMDKECEGHSLFTKEQAHQILEFVEQIKNQVELIIVHCEAGISRSAGVVAALSLIYNKSDNWVFKGGYIPNRYVYKMILNIHYSADMDDQVVERYKNLSPDK